MFVPRLVRAFVYIALSFLATVLVSSCSTHPRGTSASVQKRPVAPQQAAVQLSPDLLTAFFPVSGAEINQPSAIRTLYDEIYQNGLAACMKGQGYHIHGFIGEPPQHWATMPDLGYIKVHGLIIYGQDPGVDLTNASAATREAYDNATTQCGNQAYVPLKRFNSAVVNLSQQWMVQVQSVQDDEAVVRAYAGFVTCMHRAGINVADEAGFFAYLDGLHGIGAAQQVASQIYLPCITPVEKVRLPLRESMRATFFNEYADELRAAQRAANALVRQYASTYASLQAKPVLSTLGAS